MASRGLAQPLHRLTFAFLVSLVLLDARGVSVESLRGSRVLSPSGALSAYNVSDSALSITVRSADDLHPLTQAHVFHNFTQAEQQAVLARTRQANLTHQQCTPERTIYDMGFYDGADARSYLQQGYCVTGVEADPDLVQAGADSFAVFITSGQLRLVNVAIAPAGGEVWTEFYRSKCSKEWNSFYRTVACRSCTAPHALDNAMCEPLQLRSVSCKDILTSYGVPHYLKLDIEGAETGCFQALAELGVAQLPAYISAEITAVDYLDSLHGLGYKAFKLTRQDWLHNGVASTTGPWGDEAMDCRAGTAWRSYETARLEMQRILSLGYDPNDPCSGGICPIHAKDGCAAATVWYDVHVGRDAVPTAM